MRENGIELMTLEEIISGDETRGTGISASLKRVIEFNALCFLCMIIYVLSNCLGNV